MKMPTPKNAMECLFSRPTPSRTPNQSQRIDEPPLIIRTSRYTHPIQNSGSNAFIEKKVPTENESQTTSCPGELRSVAAAGSTTEVGRRIRRRGVDRRRHNKARRENS